MATILSNEYYVDGVGYNLNDKPSNPKDIIGSNKIPLGLVPATTMAYLAVGHAEGHLKYGLVNWREAGVRFSIYIDACLRHLQKVKEGEWVDAETHVPHLASAGTCISILIDAHHAGKLIDDRPKPVNADEAFAEMAEVLIHLKQLHGDKKPVDYFVDGAKQRE